jgi:hypothetical protein
MVEQAADDGCNRDRDDKRLGPPKNANRYQQANTKCNE